MKTVCCIICLLVYSKLFFGQDLRKRLASEIGHLQVDDQMKHGILGISIVNSKTGEKIVEINAQMGLVPASCQKIITSATALELLGPSYRFATILGYDGKIANGTLQGNLYVLGSGDPSLGSWRYESTKEENIVNNWICGIKQQGINKITGSLIGVTDRWENEIIPGGWIWDDIGNYYGAGASALNWHENQYDLVLSSNDSIGGKVTIVSMKPKPYQVNIESQLTAAAKGSGDNAYIYLPPNGKKGVVRGTIPVGEKAFTISGSFPDPTSQTLSILSDKLSIENMMPDSIISDGKKNSIFFQILKYESPALDSLNYWFLKKSINLYGEAFMKTIAFEKTGFGSTDNGIDVLKKFWMEHGIEKASLQIIDGSGLSPQNRVTVDALVKVLQYAKKRPWFKNYYDALPIFNQMKLKSGTIGGAKSFAGYHTSKDGTEYTIAFIINNYDGSAGEIVKKMFRVLDVLK